VRAALLGLLARNMHAPRIAFLPLNCRRRPQPLPIAAVFDDELQQVETFARITEASAGFEMNVQLLVGLDEPKVVESGGMGEAHARSNFFPAGIAG